MPPPDVIVANHTMLNLDDYYAAKKNQRTRRFNELQLSIPDVSKRMLTQTLRKLEQR